MNFKTTIGGVTGGLIGGIVGGYAATLAFERVETYCYEHRIGAKIHAFLAAGQAGRIVAQCKTGCRLDNVNEQVIACVFHNAEITRLAAINAKGFPEEVKI